MSVTATLWQYRPLQFFENQQDWMDVRVYDGETIIHRLEYLRAQRYNGKPIYELRPLYTREQAYELQGASIEGYDDALVQTTKRVTQLTEAIVDALKMIDSADNFTPQQVKEYAAILREAINT
jgi:hypothetical protein